MCTARCAITDKKRTNGKEERLRRKECKVIKAEADKETVVFYFCLSASAVFFRPAIKV